MTEIRGQKSDRQRILPGEIPAPVDNVLPPDRKSAGARTRLDYRGMHSRSDAQMEGWLRPREPSAMKGASLLRRLLPSVTMQARRGVSLSLPGARQKKI